jgi:hypothetical protein
MSNKQNGKGDKPRPIKNYETFISNWDNIFKKKTKTVDKKENVCDSK